MADQIADLIERVILDAHGDDQELTAFWQSFEDEGRLTMRATDGVAYKELATDAASASLRLTG